MAARAQAIASRDEAVNALAEALTSRDRAVNALAEAIATGERAADARDEALASRDITLRSLEALHARITELEAALEAARSEPNEAMDTMAARAEGAVVVLPGVAIPEAPVGPITSGSRVAWQPTWSEWSRPDGEADEAGDVVDVAEAAEIRLDDTQDDVEEEAGEPRYLNVAATIAQLLPEDLGPLLLSGAAVVRREGRLFVTVAVTSPGAEMAQVERFAEAGFRVEWTSNAPLGV
jgi:hypothetical protein